MRTGCGHLLRPGVALVGRELVGAVQAFEVVEDIGQFVRELALFEDEIAAHADDQRHMLDEDGALLHAGAAGRAIPEFFRADHTADQLALRPLAPAIAGGVLPRAQFAGEEAALIGHVAADLQDEIARAERLIGVEGRAVFEAAPAVHTGIEVHQLRPGEVFQMGDAERLRLLQILDRLQFAARLEPPEEDIHEAREGVDHLAVGEVGEEGEGRREMAEPVHLMERLQPAVGEPLQRDGERVRDERP